MLNSIRPHQHIEVRIDHIGFDRSPVVVVDHILQHPEELAADAAAQPFAPTGRWYPGLRSPVPLPYPLALLQMLREVIDQAFGLEGQAVLDSRCNYCLITRRAHEVAVRQRIPHCDTSDTSVIAVLHYLFRGDYGGTSFYRHRQTGFEMVTPERQPLYEQKLGEELAQGEPQDYLEGDSSLFQRIADCPAAYNRALIYRSASLHKADIGPDFSFSSDPRLGRLTANSSFLFGDPAALAIRR